MKKASFHWIHITWIIKYFYTHLLSSLDVGNEWALLWTVFNIFNPSLILTSSIALQWKNSHFNDSMAHSCLQLRTRYSIRGFVRPSIGLSVRLLVHHGDQVENCKKAHFRGPWCDCVCASVCGVGEGVNRHCTPMPTRPQQSCDPVSPLIYLPLSFPQTV